MAKAAANPFDQFDAPESAGPNPFDQFDGPTYDTVLTPAEEQNFKTWKAQNAPNDSGADYDLRGAFKAGLKPGPNGHWADTFKKPNHPTFSDQSQYAKDAPEKAGRWDGETYIPPNNAQAILDQEPPKGSVISDLGAGAHDIGGAIVNTLGAAFHGGGDVIGALTELVGKNPNASADIHKYIEQHYPTIHMQTAAGKDFAANVLETPGKLIESGAQRLDKVSPTAGTVLRSAARGAGDALGVTGGVSLGAAAPAMAARLPLLDAAGIAELGNKLVAPARGVADRVLGVNPVKDAAKLRAVSSRPAGELSPQQVADKAGFITRVQDLAPGTLDKQTGSALIDRFGGRAGEKVTNDINQQRASQIAKEDNNLRDLTDSAFEEAEKPHLKAYEDARKLTTPDDTAVAPEYSQALNRITSDRTTPSAALSEIARLQKDYAIPGASNKIVSDISELRQQATKNLQSDSTADNAIGRAQKKVTYALEGELERRSVLPENRQYRLVDKLRESRRAIAKIRTTRDATVAGHVDPQKLYKDNEKGTLDGGLAVIANFAEHHPHVSRHFQAVGAPEIATMNHPIATGVARVLQALPARVMARRAAGRVNGPSLDPSLTNNPMFTRPAPTPAPFELQRPQGSAFQPVQRDAQLAGQNPLQPNLDQQLAAELEAQGVPPASLGQQQEMFAQPVDQLGLLEQGAGNVSRLATEFAPETGPFLQVPQGAATLGDQLAGNFGVQGPGRSYGSLDELAQELGGAVPPRYSELAPTLPAPAAPSAVLPGPFGSTARGAPEAIRRIAGAAPDADFAQALQQLEGLGYYGGARVNVAPHAPQLADFAVPETPAPAIDTRGLALDNGGLEEFIRQMAQGKSIEQILAELSR